MKGGDNKMAPIDDLAAQLDRQVTDDEGKAMEENDTPLEETPTSEEKTTVEEDAQAEKPAESEDKATQAKSEDDEIDLVELASDETGKRYVPESRFKEVYGKMKAFERAAKEQPKTKEFIPQPPIETKPLDKTDQVEIELLRATLPQFNPDSEDYSRELDELGFAIFKATPGTTRIQAARQAVQMAKKIQSKVAKVTEEARTVKSLQSDQGITSRVTSREASSDVPGEEASPEEMEKWLKARGQW
jgi:hypothetical protein